MNRDPKPFSAEVHGYLDGDPVQPLDPFDRAEAERFNEALAVYAAELALPGREVDRAVMAAIRARTPAREQAWWRWFVQPQVLRVRPALAAAALALLIGGGVLLRRPASPGESPAEALAPAASTVLVRFELRAPNAGQVTLSGSFNDWDTAGIPLSRSAATDMWTATVPLSPGEHQYLFVIDGERWIPDPGAHAQVEDGFGNTNSLIVVGPRGVVKS